jgi:hypothetical protein
MILVLVRALQEAVVANSTAATRVLSIGSVGEAAAARVAGVAGSVEPNHRRFLNHGGKVREALVHLAGAGLVSNYRHGSDYWRL